MLVSQRHTLWLWQMSPSDHMKYCLVNGYSYYVFKIRNKPNATTHVLKATNYPFSIMSSSFLAANPMCDARIPFFYPIFLDINKFCWWFWFFDQQKTSFLLVKWPCLARNRRHPEFCTRIVGSWTSQPDPGERWPRAPGPSGHLAQVPCGAGHLGEDGSTPGEITTCLPHIYPYNLVKYLVKLPHIWEKNHPLSAFNSYVWLMDLQYLTWGPRGHQHLRHLVWYHHEKTCSLAVLFRIFLHLLLEEKYKNKLLNQGATRKCQVFACFL
jgi:hypothetical protein